MQVPERRGEECLRVKDPLTLLWSRRRTEVACVLGGKETQGIWVSLDE